MGYKLIRCPNYSENNATAIICHPVDFQPYSLMIDEYFLFFYFDLSSVDKFYQKCFGFIHMLKHAILIKLNNGEYILPAREVEVKASIKSIIDEISKQRLIKYNDLFDKINQVFVGHGEMPAEKKKKSWMK